MRLLTNTIVAATASLALCITAGLAFAQEQGRVISSQPAVQQVAVPRQVCQQQQVAVEGQKSGAGGLMGAIAGGAIGSAVGAGAGRDLATMIGVIGGAIVGDRVEGAAPSQIQTVQNCATQNFYENRTAGYNVVYEYNGRQYSVQMSSDPGPFVQLQVTPVMASPAPIMPPSAPMPVIQPVVIAPPVMYPPPPIIYSRPIYPVVQPSANFGFGWRFGPGANRHHHHWH